MWICHFLSQNGPFVINNFFWYKPLLLLSCTYWPFLLCKILKNSYSGSRVTRMHHFWAQNGPFARKNTIIWKIINITFIYLLALFIVQNFFKKFLLRILSYEDASFLGPKWFISPKEKLDFKTIINIIFIYLLAPFILPNFKKLLRANPELWGCAIFEQKTLQFVLNKIFWCKPLLISCSC